MIRDPGCLDFFSESYPQLRQKFLAGAEILGSEIKTFTSNATGPSGEALHTDIARIGDRCASRVAVIVSGTHGVEGYSGSGCLTGWLNSSPKLPDSTAVVLINLLNPYGSAWLRRQNEDNVDINRNFIDHDNAPVNAAYSSLHDALVPTDLADATLSKADQDLHCYREQFGEECYWQAFGGQYTHPDGVFYGGSEPSWSNRILQSTLLEQCKDAESVAFLDLHSGLGPFGYGTLISNDRRAGAGFKRAHRWFGESLISLASIDSEDGTELESNNTDGHTMGCVERLLREKTVTCTTLEFGTFPFDQCVPLMRKEASLFRSGDLCSEQSWTTRQQWLEVFYPNTPDWLEMIWRRSGQVFRQLIDGLSES